MPVTTYVDRISSSNGDPILKVVFCGEPGDCITVEMAGADLTGDIAAIETARSILVQTASVPTATNDYDAQSNGDFDEVSVTSVKDDASQTYIFEFRDGESLRQVPPSQLPSFEVAREEALCSAIDLLVDLQPGIDELSGWLVRVRNNSGVVLCTIDVAEAEANISRFS